MVFEAKLVVKALGRCSVAYEDRIISDETMGSKKFWTALEYLVLHRDRPVTQAELINVLYREGESFNPGNALKTLIHRIRESLSTLQYIDGRKIILNVRGAYKWNTKIEYEYDLERFENLVKKLDAQPLSEDERLDISLSALDAYDGSCLPKFKQEDWAQEVIEKYNSMFKRTLLSTIELLKKRSDYEKIVSLCRHAINLDPYDESLYYHVIDGLVVLGDNESALREYNRMSDLFYKQYGISPSIELRKMLRPICQ